MRTGPAHRKYLHAGAFSVVRQCVKYSHARTAVGAVDKGMQVAPVSFIKELFFAVITDSYVRGNVYGTLGFCTVDDCEVLIYRQGAPGFRS